MAVDNALLTAAKNYFDITWNDIAGDAKLAGILERGMAYINRIGGKSLDYSSEDKPRELLFEYARYARENALNDFANNYLTEIMGLYIDCEGEYYETTRTDV